MWALITGLVGTLIGAGVKHYAGERGWEAVRAVAKSILRDPEKTNDPRQAVAEALIQENLNRLATEAEKVEKAFIVNGSNPYPKLDR